MELFFGIVENMAKAGDTILTEILNFDGGMTSDVRKKDTQFSNRILGFDMFSFQGRLMPQFSMSADSFATLTAAKAALVKFLSYGTSQSATDQWALGYKDKSVDNKPGIWKRASLPSGAWTIWNDYTYPASEKFFIEYKGILYWR